MEKKSSLACRLISAGLCAALLFISPGPAAYAAAGQIAAVKVVAPVGSSMGMVGGSFDVGAADRLGAQLTLSPIARSANLIPGSAAPLVTSRSLAFSVEQESPVAVAETLAASVVESNTAAPVSGQAALIGQAQDIQAVPGRMQAPAARVQIGILKTLRAIFSVRSTVEGLGMAAAVPVAELGGVSAASRLQPAVLAEKGIAAQVPAASILSAQAPANSAFKTVMRWALPILAVTALVFGLDFGTKFLAAKFLVTVFHECAWRAPLLAVIIPYIGISAFLARKSLPNDHMVWHWSVQQMGNGRLGFYRAEVSGLDTMSKEHPSLRWALRLYDLSIAMMLGGMLGNGIDGFRLGGALDWIPLGRSLMNFADVALLCGLAFFQLATSFFLRASEAHHDNKPLYMSMVGFLGLPLVGFFIAWAFGSAATDVPLNMAMKSVAYIYIMGFSMLLGISRFLAALVVDRFAKRFVSEQGNKKS